MQHNKLLQSKNISGFYIVCIWFGLYNCDGFETVSAISEVETPDNIESNINIKNSLTGIYLQGTSRGTVTYLFYLSYSGTLLYFFVHSRCHSFIFPYYLLLHIDITFNSIDKRA